MQVDPLADVTHSMSAYQYAGNNPVLFNDPSGLLRAPADPSGDWSSWETYVSNGGEGYVVPGGGGGGRSGGHWSDQYHDTKHLAMFGRSSDYLVWNPWTQEYLPVNSVAGRALLRNKGDDPRVEVVRRGTQQGRPGDPPSRTDILLAGVGTVAFVDEKLAERIIKSRAGFTSGKLFPNSPFIYSKAEAQGIKLRAKTLGWGLTLWSVYNTEIQFGNGEIDAFRRQYNHFNSGVGVLFPVTAIPLAVGDYYGQTHASEIVKDVSQPGGVTFEVTKFLLELVGLPISANDK